MPVQIFDKSTKILLVLLATGVVSACLLLVAVILWFSFTSAGHAADQRWNAKQNEGSEFGKTTDQRGCISEGFKRGATLGPVDIDGHLQNRNFVKGCLLSSRATPGFCDGVPSELRNIFSEWDEKKCDKIDIPTAACQGVLKEQIQFCDR